VADNFHLAIKKVGQAVRKTLAKELEDSVYKKINDLENQLEVIKNLKDKKEGILNELVNLSKSLVDAQSGKAKARREATKELDLFLEKIRPFPDALKKKNIKEVVGDFKQRG